MATTKGKEDTGPEGIDVRGDINFEDASFWVTGDFDLTAADEYINDPSVSFDERNRRFRAVQTAVRQADLEIEREMNDLSAGLGGIGKLSDERADRLGLGRGITEAGARRALSRRRDQIGTAAFAQPTETKEEVKEEALGGAEEEFETLFDIFKENYPEFLETFFEAQREQFPEFFAARKALGDQIISGLTDTDQAALEGLSEEFREAASARGTALGGSAALEEALGRSGLAEQFRAGRIGQALAFTGMGTPQAGGFPSVGVDSPAAGFNPFAQSQDTFLNQQIALGSASPGGGGFDPGAFLTDLIKLKVSKG